jgi:hypothetical protein
MASLAYPKIKEIIENTLASAYLSAVERPDFRYRRSDLISTSSCAVPAATQPSSESSS